MAGAVGVEPTYYCLTGSFTTVVIHSNLKIFNQPNWMQHKMPNPMVIIPHVEAILQKWPIQTKLLQ